MRLNLFESTTAFYTLGIEFVIMFNVIILRVNSNKTLKHKTLNIILEFLLKFSKTNQ